jgi:kynurenine 3-monooxygenase
LLIGDAVHAIVPFYGQGMNAGFEDCRILMDLAEDRNYRWEDVFEVFQEIRKKDTDAISDLAMDNFIVMRDNVSDDRFLERLAYERELNRTYPDQWVPLYSMVTFSDIPYNRAKELGDLQRKAMDTYDWNPDNMNKIIEEFNDLKRAGLPTRR